MRPGDWAVGWDASAPTIALPYCAGKGCGEVSRHSMTCTRKRGHTGRHAASGVSRVLEVWS